jgi:chromosome segregation ATPase
MAQTWHCVPCPLHAEVCTAKHQALAALLKEKDEQLMVEERRVAELNQRLAAAQEAAQQLQAQLAEQKAAAVALRKKWQDAQRMFDDQEEACKPWPIGLDHDAISSNSSMKPVRLEGHL